MKLYSEEAVTLDLSLLVFRVWQISGAFTRGIVMPMGVNELCQTCKFRVGLECHRFPAEYRMVWGSPGPVWKLMYPTITLTDQCGEYQLKLL